MPNALVIEDNDALRELVCRAFERKGWVACGSPTPTEARKRAAHQHFDVIVADVMLPELNGFQLAEQIGEMQQTVPFIFISGYPKDYLTRRLAGGSDLMAILEKPFNMHALVTRASHLSEPRPLTTLPVFDAA